MTPLWKLNLGLSSSVLLLLIGPELKGMHLPGINMLAQLASFVLCIWTASGYAERRGYSGGWGALGLLNVVGVFIVLLFPNRRQRQ